MASDQTLVGRSTELERVLSLVARVEQGRGAVGLIEGEAGIGKTAVLEATLAAVAPRGYLVLRGAARELEGDRPFAALAEAMGLHRASADLERVGIAALLLDEANATAGDLSRFAEVRSRLIESIVSLTERLGLAGPVLLALEDLHWADSSTVLAVHHIGRRLAYLPVVLLATYRPSPRSTILDRVAGDVVDGGGLHVVLEPLDHAAVATLVEGLAQAAPTARLLAATKQAGGNPLFIKELIAALHADGALQIIDGRADADIRVIPYSFRRLVLRQLVTLPDTTRRILRVAAVLGASFSLTELAPVLGRLPSDLLDDLDEAFRAKILHETGESMSFRHELVREAVYLDLPTTVRRGLHLQVGWALAAAGASPIQVAPHLVRGASPGDDNAVEWLSRAAAQLAPRLPGAAVELFDHALSLIPTGEPQRYAIMAELVDALIWSGRYHDAVAQAHQLFRLDRDSGRRNAVRLSITRAMLIAGRIEDAKTEVEVALRDFSGNQRDRLHLDMNLAFTRVFSGDPVGARAIAQDALERAEGLDDDQVPQIAYPTICIAALLAGDVPAAVAAGTRAWELGGPSVSLAHRYGSHIFLGTALMEGDRLDAADRVLRDGQRIAEEVGMSWQPIYYHAQIGLVHFDAGRWDDAIAELEAASRVSEENVGAPATFGEAMSAVVEVHRGAVDLAARHVARAHQALTEGHRLGADSAMWAAALVQEAQGDTGAALVTLEKAWRFNLAMGFRSQNARFSLDLVRWALAGGRPELATAVVEELAQLAELNPTPSRIGLASACLGLVKKDLDVIHSAIQVYRDSLRMAERAWACLAAGSAFAQAGQQDTAVELLNEGIRGCEQFGADRDIAQADAALRKLGIRRGRRGPRKRPRTGWDSLTPTELSVVTLVVEGLTNAQLGQRLAISARTVETHLSRVFDKLGVSSRVQVAVEAARRLATDDWPES